MTKSGYTCQRWDMQKPHKHESNTPETKPRSGLDRNYCRNPDQEPMGPWCYTTTPGKRWDYCNVKLCKSGRLLMRQRDLSNAFLRSFQNERVSDKGCCYSLLHCLHVSVSPVSSGSPSCLRVGSSSIIGGPCDGNVISKSFEITQRPTVEL